MVCKHIYGARDGWEGDIRLIDDDPRYVEDRFMFCPRCGEEFPWGEWDRKWASERKKYLMRMRGHEFETW